MLIQYSVQNYKSIKDEVVINFSATKKNMENDKILKESALGNTLYRCIGLIGPNASGKSNIIKSLIFAFGFINSTISRKEKSKINTETFMLDKAYKENASSFEFIFLENNTKYVYGFSVNYERVVEEYLLAYFSQKATTVFERSIEDENEYNFKGNDTKLQTEISQKTNANRLYLPVAAEWGYEKVKIPYKWFERMFEQYTSMDTSQVIAKVLESDVSKKLLMEALFKADFNIKNIYVNNRKIERKQREAVIQLLRFFLDEKEIPEDIIPAERPIIWVTHCGENGETMDVELEEDSSGTKDLIENIAELLFVGKNRGLLIEDEFGKNYHTKLMEYFLNLFNTSFENNDGAQLLFCSHDTKILNLLEPEQIYLVDKDKNGATYVKLLDDYIIREKDNIELGYLKGRYGAIPDIKE